MKLRRFGPSVQRFLHDESLIGCRFDLNDAMLVALIGGRVSIYG